jgi:serine/threonine protein phosphatase PrpC
VLADGAGGQGGGDVAAQTAVTAAKAEFLGLPVFSPNTLRRCMDKADADIRAKQKEAPRLARMASTFVALLVNYQRSQVLFGNLGDSRCYVFRGDRVIAQSYDHSLVQRFIDAGLYPIEKLRQHPKRNVLYASLGANEEGVIPYLTEVPIDLRPGDGVLLCSDGVWELLEDASLGHLHAISETVEIWRDQLVARLEDCMPDGHDNFSAIMVRCLPEGSPDDDTDRLRTVQPSLG